MYNLCQQCATDECRQQAELQMTHRIDGCTNFVDTRAFVGDATVLADNVLTTTTTNFVK